MTTNPYDRIAELGAELMAVAEKMRSAAAHIESGSQYAMSGFVMCEARVIGIAAELRVIVAGHQGV